MIKHIWFDFSETLAFLNKERHNQLRYNTYAEIIGRKVTPELIQEYENLYQKFQKSNAAVFRSLGQSANFWSEKINSLKPEELYYLSDKSVLFVLSELRKNVPISLFSNIQVSEILRSLDIPAEWFANILSAGMVKEPKPSLEGYYKIVELSKLPADEILYIGDDLGKDVEPAKKVGLKTGLMWKKSDRPDYCFERFEDILKIDLQA